MKNNSLKAVLDVKVLNPIRSFGGVSHEVEEHSPRKLCYSFLLNEVNQLLLKSHCSIKLE